MPSKGTSISMKWTLLQATLFLLLTLCSILNLVDSDASTASTSSSSSAAAKDDVVPSSSSGSDVPLYATNNIKPHPETPSDMGSVIPGVFKEYLPQPIFYESIVPSVFQYRTPLWNKTEVTFNNWYQCVSETVPYRYSCPVTFHMNKAIVNLHVDFEGLHPISDIRTQDLQISTKDYYDRLTGHSDFCDKIQKHFAGIWTELSEVERYFTALHGCARGSELHPIINRGLEDYNYGIRQVFTKMENNFYNTFYKNILGSGGKNSTMDLVASALLSNTRTSLQGAILGQYYAEKNRWVHANQDCRQGVIPTSLVTPEKFNETLSAILKMSIFHKEDTELSIPIGQMSKYYTLPLADCTHTADSMVVRILVPILRKFRGEVFQLIHVHTIPFIYKDHICRVKFPPTSYSSSSSFRSSGIDAMMGENENSGSSLSSMFLYNEFSHRAYPTSCRPNELCKISQYMLDSQRSDPCVSSLLAKNDTGIRRHCDFECLPKTNYVLPSVVRVASNKFVVTGNSLSFTIVCGRLNHKEKLVHLDDDQIGAVLVKLPCYCRMIIPHFNVYFTGKGCPPEQDIAADGSQQGRIVNAEEEESYEQNEVEVISIIPFMFARMKDEKGEHLLEKMANPGNHYEDQYDTLEEGQILNLTEIIDRERIEHYIKSSEVRREMERNKFKGMDFYAEKLQSGESLNEDEKGGVGGFFWTVFIISVMIIFGLQLYIIVIFQRQQRISYSKDDTILYRVEPEDADTTSLG